jgi:hypothetical protein
VRFGFAPKFASSSGISRSVSRISRSVSGISQNFGQRPKFYLESRGIDDLGKLRIRGYTNTDKGCDGS